MFRVGQKVIRTQPDWGQAVKGGVYTISKINDNGSSIFFKEIEMGYTLWKFNALESLYKIY